MDNTVTGSGYDASTKPRQELSREGEQGKSDRQALPRRDELVTDQAFMLRCGKNLDQMRERGGDTHRHALGSLSVLTSSGSTVTCQEQTGVGKSESSFWRL